MKPPADQRFTRGLELFNAEKFFECHDVIEELWLETDSADPYRDLYKGVIQAAAALYQFERGILSGALGLSRTAVGYLEKYAPEALGLKVSRLMEGLRLCFKELETWDGKTKVKLPNRLIPKAEFKA